jgi:hypothetical protein
MLPSAPQPPVRPRSGHELWRALRDYATWAACSSTSICVCSSGGRPHCEKCAVLDGLIGRLESGREFDVSRKKICGCHIVAGHHSNPGRYTEVGLKLSGLKPQDSSGRVSCVAGWERRHATECKFRVRAITFRDSGCHDSGCDKPIGARIEKQKTADVDCVSVCNGRQST